MVYNGCKRNIWLVEGLWTSFATESTLRNARPIGESYKFPSKTQLTGTISFHKEKIVAPIFASVSWTNYNLASRKAIVPDENPQRIGEAVKTPQGGFEHMAWSAIRVATGREDIVCENIRSEVDRMGYEADYRLLVPKRKLLETNQGKTNEVLRKKTVNVEISAFTGYVINCGMKFYEPYLIYLTV
jgi:hypothetical protein